VVRLEAETEVGPKDMRDAELAEAIAKFCEEKGLDRLVPPTIMAACSLKLWSIESLAGQNRSARRGFSLTIQMAFVSSINPAPPSCWAEAD
jgi:hypothetical protein